MMLFTWLFAIMADGKICVIFTGCSCCGLDSVPRDLHLFLLTALIGPLRCFGCWRSSNRAVTLLMS
eukprot:192031-Amphidinium_carterae.1